MDWTQTPLPAPKNPRPQSGEMSRLDYWRLYVISKLSKKSMASVTQTALVTYLRQNWDEHEQLLTVEATARGMTPEQLFAALVEDRIDL
jgi:methionyl-tRNA synthetase